MYAAGADALDRKQRKQFDAWQLQTVKAAPQKQGRVSAAIGKGQLPPSPHPCIHFITLNTAHSQNQCGIYRAVSSGRHALASLSHQRHYYHNPIHIYIYMYVYCTYGLYRLPPESLCCDFMYFVITRCICIASASYTQYKSLVEGSNEFRQWHSRVCVTTAQSLL